MTQKLIKMFSKFFLILLLVLVFLLPRTQVWAVDSPSDVAKKVNDTIESLTFTVEYNGKSYTLQPGTDTLYKNAEGKVYIDEKGETLIFDPSDSGATTYSVSIGLNRTELSNIAGLNNYSEVEFEFNCPSFLGKAKEAWAALYNGGSINSQFDNLFTNLKENTSEIFQKGSTVELKVNCIKKDGTPYCPLNSKSKFNFEIEPLLIQLPECEISFDGLKKEQDTSVPGVHFIEGADVNSDITVKISELDSEEHGAALYQDGELIKGGFCDKTINLIGCKYSLNEPDDSHHIGCLDSGSYTFAVRYNPLGVKDKVVDFDTSTDKILCKKTLTVVPDGDPLVPPGDNITGEDIVEMDIEIEPALPLCETIPENAMCGDASCQQKCIDCYGIDDENKGVWTALGCLPTDISGIVSSLFTIFSGVFGGLVFLCLVVNGIIIMTSRGNPEALKKGQESITACLVGFLVLVMSVLFLKIVGADILDLPGWS